MLALNSSVEHLKGLPATLIVTAEFNVLLDEGEAYGRKLLEAGVDCTTLQVDAVTHDFLLLSAVASARPVLLVMEAAGIFLRGVLT